MDRIHAGGCDEPLSDTTLVAHNDDLKLGLVEQRNRLGNSGKKMHFLPAGHVTISRSFPVDYTVTI
jgi:hypothetical protein